MMTFPFLFLVVPTFYVASLIDTVRANGSSPTGHCVGFDITSPNVYCNAPGTSVLFDGHIPTLSDVGGDTWASDLLTLRTEANINLFESYVSMLYMFHNQRDYSGVRRMELVLFNCPQWGISVGSVEVNEFNSENTTTLAIQSVGTSSCDSLVRVCVSVSTASTNLQVKFLSVPATDFYVYIAEITFYADSSSCPPEALVSTDTVTTAGGSPDLTTDSTPGSNPTCSTQREACPSCAATNSWTPVVAATSTALLAVLVFALVQIAICKCRQRGGKERGEREDPVYDQVSEGCV